MAGNKCFKLVVLWKWYTTTNKYDSKFLSRFVTFVTHESVFFDQSSTWINLLILHRQHRPETETPIRESAVAARTKKKKKLNFRFCVFRGKEKEIISNKIFVPCIKIKIEVHLHVRFWSAFSPRISESQLAWKRTDCNASDRCIFRSKYKLV